MAVDIINRHPQKPVGLSASSPAPTPGEPDRPHLQKPVGLSASSPAPTLGDVRDDKRRQMHTHFFVQDYFSIRKDFDEEYFLFRMLNRKPLRGSFGWCIPFPPVAAYGVNWGLLARTPTGFIREFLNALTLELMWRADYL